MEVHFEVVVGVYVFGIFIVVGDLLLGVELGQILQLLHPQAGFLAVQFDILAYLDGVDDLLEGGNSQFLNFVAPEEEINFDEVLTG